MELVNKDGTKIIEADERFVTAPSPILFDDMRLGEIYDATKEIPNWCLPDFDDSGWKPVRPAPTPCGIAKLCDCEPIHTLREITPVRITAIDDGYLYDFGENLAGILRLDIDAVEGQNIHIDFGEWLRDGKLCRDNLLLNNVYECRQDIYYTCRSGKQVYRPSFTYHGFRYAFVTGITEQQATVALLTYEVTGSDFADAGSFTCSNDMLVKTQQLAVTTARSNFQYYPIDCPHREKAGWTGDSMISTDYFLRNLYCEKSLEQWLCCIRETQGHDGKVSSLTPDCGWGFIRNDGPAWDNAVVEIPYVIYTYTQDRCVLEDNASAIFSYITYLASHHTNGLINYGLCDWHEPHHICSASAAPVCVTSSILAYDACMKASQIFEKLGKTLEENYARTLAADFRRSIREKLIDFQTMTVEGYCQTSQAMALYYNIFDPAEKKQAFEVLLDCIKEKDGSMSVGIIGTRVLYSVLSDFGHGDMAVNMVATTKWPSYGYLIAHDATSLWEDFYIEERLYAKNGKRPSSMNHHMFGSVATWFSRSLGGLRFNFDGSVDIRPDYTSGLEFVHAECRGIKVEWHRTAEGFDMKLDYDRNLYCNREIRVVKQPKS